MMPIEAPPGPFPGVSRSDVKGWSSLCLQEMHQSQNNGKGADMTFEELLDQVLVMLQRRGRVSYRTLTRQFALDEADLEDLKEAILFAHPQAVDEADRGLVWTSDAGAVPLPAPDSPQPVEQTGTPIPR